MDDILQKLNAPFPQESVHWRPQSVSRDGTKALALAYIDARDVMDRLDMACTPVGWQDEHYAVGNITACKIGIKNTETGEWLWKSDGAGDTHVEAEKGAMSGAFKRAAVAWGIGRYLYDMKSVWVPCKCKRDKIGNLILDRNQKPQFIEFAADPWTCVKGVFKATPSKQQEPQKQNDDLKNAISANWTRIRDYDGTYQSFTNWVTGEKFATFTDRVKKEYPSTWNGTDDKQGMADLIAGKSEELKNRDDAAGGPPDFPDDLQGAS